jgi:hypothetical protein
VPKQSPDEKKANIEAIRVAKANATQEAREAKKTMSLCQKYLRRATKLTFNLNKATAPKFIKGLPEADAARLQACKARLAKMQKTLMASIVKGGKSEVCEGECDTACKDGEAVLEQLSRPQALTASLI